MSGESGFLGIRAGPARKIAFRVALARWAKRRGHPPPSMSDAVRALMDAIIVMIHEGRDEEVERLLARLLDE